jgi:cysteine desulfurase
MNPIYLDYQATTPVDPRVVSAMAPYWTEEFGNPHSEGHPFGWKARQAVEFARSQVADFIGADDDEIIFLSGATESCNLAIRGLAASDPSTQRNHIVTLTTEHLAVLETALWMGRHGLMVDVLPVKPDGLLDLGELRAVMSERTLLVSVMLVNNEIGVIQPIKEIAGICGEVGAFMHTDATQAAGRIKIDVDELGVDLLSLSGHKIYGPNGVGALYLRNRPGLRLQPIMTGGSQERGLRPGTVATPLVVGMGAACAIAGQQLQQDTKRLTELGHRLLSVLKRDFPNLRTFGSMDLRVPGNLNLGIPGVPAENLVDAVASEVAISTGAACSTGSPDPSHVLIALGIDPELAATAVRISLGRFTTDDEVNAAITSLRRVLKIMTR